MTIIHMETEQVRSVARQLDVAAEQIHHEMEQVARRVRGIPWQSPGRDSYVAALDGLRRKIQALAQQGVALSQRVQREVDEWEEAAASFGAIGAASGIEAGMQTGSDNAPAESHPRPDNMRLLANLVMEGDDPIRIYEIGPNEYLVAIQGTSFDPNASQNWGSAIATGLGLSSDYQEQVRLALLGLPAGAIVHMAGHSQGGIVAQNLAGDKSVSNHLSVKTVTTFGSSYSSPEVDGVTYYRYAAEGDVVPYLEGRDATTALLLTPFLGFVPAAAGALSNIHPQTRIPSSNPADTFGETGPHFEYNKSSALENISGKKMPFEITAWNGQPTVCDPGNAHSGAAAFYKNVVAPAIPTAGNAAQSAAGAVSGAADSPASQVGNFFGNLF